MAFPDDQNNLNDEPVPLTGNQSVAWAQLVVNWIRDILVPAIKGMVAPINIAKNNAGTALITAQARMTTNMSNIQQARTTVENLTDGPWTGNRAGWILALNPSQAGLVLKEEDTGISLDDEIITTDPFRSTKRARSTSNISGSQLAHDSVADWLDLVAVIPAGHVIVGAVRSEYTRRVETTYERSPMAGGGTGTRTSYNKSYQYRLQYRRVITS